MPGGRLGHYSSTLKEELPGHSLSLTLRSPAALARLSEVLGRITFPVPKSAPGVEERASWTN